MVMLRGLVAYVLQNSGVPRDEKNVKRALVWLGENQNPAEGSWVAYSLNKNRVLTSDVGRFMSDAATGYAVLALTGTKIDRATKLGVCGWRLTQR